MKNRILIGTISVATILYWLILFFRIDLFQFIPGYTWHFMHYTDKPLTYIALIIPLVLIAYYLINYVLKQPDYHKRNLFLLIVLGFLIQIVFGFTEGRGIDGIRQRMLATGHAEFAKIASSGISIIDVATNYEQGLEQNEAILFAKTKPPGHLLFYMLTERISNMFSPSSDPAERLKMLSTLAAYLYPLLSYLVIIPLYYFGRMFMKSNNPILPCIMYLFIPSVTLVTLHLDQVLYPLLFMTCLLFILYSFKARNLAVAVLSGLLVYILLYFSFSLLVIIPAGLLSVGAFIYSEDKNGWKEIVNIRLIMGLIAGFMIGLIFFWLVLDYNIFVRYQNAMTYHLAWKGWDGSLSTVLLYGTLNLIEYACWLGLPLSILFLSKIKISNIQSFKENLNFENLFMLSTVLIFLLLGYFGKTKSEVGRLWIFMMPVVLIFVSCELQNRFGKNIKPALWFILTLQLISILFIKRFQDFW